MEESVMRIQDMGTLVIRVLRAISVLWIGRELAGMGEKHPTPDALRKAGAA